MLSRLVRHRVDPLPAWRRRRQLAAPIRHTCRGVCVVGKDKTHGGVCAATGQTDVLSLLSR